MKGLGLVAALLVLLVTVARSGHELPVYPSYYPHEIEIQTLAPEQAAALLTTGKLHAYLGAAPGFSPPAPESVRAIESLGALVTVRVNPASPRAKDGRAGCALGGAVVRDLAVRPGVVFHPYPVTPFHGDYLYHADLAETSNARLSGAPAALELKVRADGSAKNLVRPDWLTHDSDWDVEIAQVDIARLVATSTVAVNGWLGPPWVRSGWYLAHRLLADALDDPAAKARVETDLRRLTTGEFDDLAERVNLERDLVSALTAGCRKMVAGYTVRRQFFSAEYSAGIENIAYDSIEGFASPMFLRTVKLKDFPWNGWLALGVETRPAAAWNPIGGMTDEFGRLMWFALGDPAVIPSPNDANWSFNRISDVQALPRR